MAVLDAIVLVVDSPEPVGLNPNIGGLWKSDQSTQILVNGIWRTITAVRMNKASSEWKILTTGS